MASTGAVLYVRPRITATETPARTTGAVLYIPARLVAGVYQTGVVDSASRRLSDSWLPAAGVPIGWVTVDGKRLPVHIDVHSWYRFLNTVAEVKLGGFSGNTVPDVVAAVETTQTAAVSASRLVAAVASQTQTNAEALDAARQVIVNNSLTGASQIPAVQLSAGESIP